MTRDERCGCTDGSVFNAFSLLVALLIAGIVVCAAAIGLC